jgi:DNA-binding transcriptional regulator YiaG
MSNHATMEEPLTVQLAEIREICASGEARAIREAANLTLGEIARDVDVAGVTILRWETCAARPTGQRAVRYLHLLRRLARRPRQPLTAGPVRS